jgi:hypothetical protein
VILHIQRGRKRTPVGNPYLCMDDYGNAVFRCHLTEQPVIVGNHRIMGNVVPQADVCYVVRQGTEQAERDTRARFHESEANCNMCRHFERFPYKKQDFAISGLFYGRCRAGNVPEPYPMDADGVFAVAPEDWQGNECWQARGDYGH